jgi:arsenite methyltransferase
MQKTNNDSMRDQVRARYGEIGKEKASGCGCSGSNSSCCGSVKSAEDISLTMGYSSEEITLVPEGANLGLGCGNPQAIAALQPGEMVLDLGSGGGFDAFLAAQKVGSNGRVIGVDMTAEMVSRARRNAEKGGYTNVEFRLGEIENLPVGDGQVDVIMSNCVINLSPEKQRVFDEAFRVLKPGGRLAISDVVAIAEMPDAVKDDIALTCSCVSGAASVEAHQKMLAKSGFTEISIDIKEESKDFIDAWDDDVAAGDFAASAIIRAKKSSG